MPKTIDKKVEDLEVGDELYYHLGRVVSTQSAYSNSNDILVQIEDTSGTGLNGRWFSYIWRKDETVVVVVPEEEKKPLEVRQLGRFILLDAYGKNPNGGSKKFHSMLDDALVEAHQLTESNTSQAITILKEIAIIRGKITIKVEREDLV